MPRSSENGSVYGLDTGGGGVMGMRPAGTFDLPVISSSITD